MLQCALILSQNNYEGLVFHVLLLCVSMGADISAENIHKSYEIDLDLVLGVISKISNDQIATGSLDYLYFDSVIAAKRPDNYKAKIKAEHFSKIWEERPDLIEQFAENLEVCLLFGTNTIRISLFLKMTKYFNKFHSVFHLRSQPH